MENAGAIFYDEGSVTGIRRNEGLIAHEIVHHWFGNQVTETDWPHLWLSEGFATYLTHVYFEMTYGEEVRQQRMERDRQQVINFARNFPERALVDSTYQTPTELLNANSYQKGSWVLHMLRVHVGDDAFFGGLRAFYDEFRGSNADTEDFRRVMEGVSGQDLEEFFDQWVYRPGVPQIEVTVERTAEELKITFRQTQPGDVYHLQVGVGMNLGRHVHFMEFTLTDREHTFVKSSGWRVFYIHEDILVDITVENESRDTWKSVIED